MDKIKKVSEVIKYIEDGMTLMIGGLLGVGTPKLLLDELLKKGVKDLTVIVNDASFKEQDYGALIAQRRVTKLYTSHIDTNTEIREQINSGDLEVIIKAQNILSEQIRAAGAGLGAVVTKIEDEEKIAKSDNIIDMEGEKYIIQKPLQADVALIKAKISDKSGNLIYDQTAQNFNPIMAMAADLVIVEVDKIVESGVIDSNEVMTPHIFVDYIVKRN